MSLVRYYCLESHSWKKVRSLKKNITDHFLNQEMYDAFEKYSEEEVYGAMEGEGKEEIINELITNVQGFRIIYCNSEKKAKGKFELTDWFVGWVPKKIETRLVFESKYGNHLRLDVYLRDLGLEIKEHPLNNPNTIIEFVTSRTKQAEQIDDYIDVKKQFLDEHFSNILKYSLTKIVGSDDSYCRGYLDGECRNVFYARGGLRHGIGGTKIEEENIRFYGNRILRLT